MNREAGAPMAEECARVMVDDLIPWPQKADTAQGRRYFGEGKESCHLTIDPGTPIDVLHAFAQKIGMKRAWFQDSTICPHYDLTPRRRVQAIVAGAVYVPWREQAVARRAARKRAVVAVDAVEVFRCCQRPCGHCGHPYERCGGPGACPACGTPAEPALNAEKP